MAGDRSAGTANDIAISPHFRLREFQCRCCGLVRIEPELVAALERLREALGGRPLLITSGWRCSRHNAAVGGAARSRHLAGRAADIRMSAADQARALPLAREAGFTEVIAGGAKGYLHAAV